MNAIVDQEKVYTLSQCDGNINVIVRPDGSGIITTDLQQDLYRLNREGTDKTYSETIEDARVYNAAIDGLESLILAIACEGIDIESVPFQDAVQTALDTIERNYG